VTAVTALLVALGAAVGAPARYLSDRALQAAHGTGFPWGTLTVNVVASLVLGVVLGGPAPHAVAAAVGVGFCGGLSTWSTLGYETVRLAEDGERSAAVLNVVVSTLAGLGAAGVGLALGAALWA
jgi:fluoride exporter